MINDSQTYKKYLVSLPSTYYMQGCCQDFESRDGKFFYKFFFHIPLKNFLAFVLCFSKCIGVAASIGPSLAMALIVFQEKEQAQICDCMSILQIIIGLYLMKIFRKILQNLSYFFLFYDDIEQGIRHSLRGRLKLYKMKNRYDIFGFSYIYKKWQMKCFTRSFHQAKTFFVKYETTTSITEIF